jgi:hypothetical protein
MGVTKMKNQKVFLVNIDGVDKSGYDVECEFITGNKKVAIKKLKEALMEAFGINTIEFDVFNDWRIIDLRKKAERRRDNFPMLKKSIASSNEQVN